MQRPILALDVAPDMDLAAFCRELWKQQLHHRVITQDGRRLVLVSSQEDAKRVQDLYEGWKLGRISPQGAPQRVISGRDADRIINLLRHYPALSGIIVVALLCYPVTWSLQQNQLNVWLTALNLIPVTEVAGRLQFGNLVDALTQGQIWRLISPAFLHFSIMHLLFDAAVVVEFGRRIEAGMGSLPFLWLFLLLAVISNLTEYFTQGPRIFGGLSGVAYGLVGFVVVMHRLRPERSQWAYQRPLVVSLLVFLVLFSSGITEAFGLYIANAAHWSGLVAGCLLAGLNGMRKVT